MSDGASAHSISNERKYLLFLVSCMLVNQTQYLQPKKAKFAILFPRSSSNVPSTLGSMAPKQVITSDKGLKSNLFSQATIHNGTVYVSGNIGIVPSTMKVVEGSVADRTVRTSIFGRHAADSVQKQALENIRVVLEEAGSSFAQILKMNIYLTDMQDYAAMNNACA
jgi:2-iminobutanoate/2-iminopropanoate deaminase